MAQITTITKTCYYSYNLEVWSKSNFQP